MSEDAEVTLNGSGCLGVVVALLLLMFLFLGDPDVFDAVQAWVIRSLRAP